MTLCGRPRSADASFFSVDNLKYKNMGGCWSRRDQYSPLDEDEYARKSWLRSADLHPTQLSPGLGDGRTRSPFAYTLMKDEPWLYPPHQPHQPHQPYQAYQPYPPYLRAGAPGEESAYNNNLMRDSVIDAALTAAPAMHQNVLLHPE